MASSDDFELAEALFARIKNMEPEYALIIACLLRAKLDEATLVSLACNSFDVLHSVVLKVKTFILQYSSNTNTNTNTSYLHSSANPSSSATIAGSSNNPIIPKSTSLLLSHYHNNNSNNNNNNEPSSSSSQLGMNDVCNTFNSSDLFVGHFLSFPDESPPHNTKNHDLVVDPVSSLGLELGRAHAHVHPHGVHNASAHFLRGRHSSSDVCSVVSQEEPGARTGNNPCFYFARGFCIYGSSCKFTHSASTEPPYATCDAGVVAGKIVRSPTKFEGFEEQHRRRLMPSPHFMAGPSSSPSSRNQYTNFNMQQRYDPQRAGAVAAFGRGRPERNDFLAMASAEKLNATCRQIFIWFPTEGKFREKDVAEYFSEFGPVEQVRFPNPEKRYGFVIFVSPESARLVLSKENPHFVCGSSVIVKPYREEVKLPDK